MQAIDTAGNGVVSTLFSQLAWWVVCRYEDEESMTNVACFTETLVNKR
jgi:hypothetical protein